MAGSLHVGPIVGPTARAALLRAAFAGVLIALLPACGEQSTPGQAFEVTDSAGVTLVRNPASVAWPEGREPSVEEDLRIGMLDGPLEYQFGSIAYVDAGADGTIYVADGGALNIRVFDANGAWVRTIGRGGDGPGEFTRTAAVLVGPGDTLYVADVPFAGVGRLSAFGPDGSVVGTARMGPSERLSISLRWGAASGAFVAETRIRGSGASPTRTLVRYDSRTGTASALLELGPEAAADAPKYHSPSPLWTMLTEARIVVGHSHEARWTYHLPDGRVDRVVTRDAQPGVFTAAEEGAMIEHIEAGLRQTALDNPQAAEMVSRALEEPITVDESPWLYGSLVGGPGNTLWALRMGSLDDAREGGFDPEALGRTNRWDVFDPDGRFRGIVALPERFTPMRSVGDHMYGVEFDDLGVPYLVRLRVSIDGTPGR